MHGLLHAPLGRCGSWTTPGGGEGGAAASEGHGCASLLGRAPSRKEFGRSLGHRPKPLATGRVIWAERLGRSRHAGGLGGDQAQAPTAGGASSSSQQPSSNISERLTPLGPPMSTLDFFPLPLDFFPASPVPFDVSCAAADPNHGATTLSEAMLELGNAGSSCPLSVPA